MEGRGHFSGDIVLSGARENNLKNVSLTIPKGTLTVFTGVSGSGKSSIVFDTIAVESQRQLNETFPAYVRNRLARHARPRAEVMENLSTAIVVDQKPLGGNSRSTVGTMTEIQPMLRVLFSRHGQPSAGPSNHYSFNDPHGMCETCHGLGRTVTVALERLLDETRTLNEGAITYPSFAPGTAQWQLYAESGLFDPDKPISSFTEQERELLLYGGGFKVDRRSRDSVYKNEYEGVLVRFTRRYLNRDADSLSQRDRKAVAEVTEEGICPECAGGRLNSAALESRIGAHNIADYCAMEVNDLIPVLEALHDPVAKPVAQAALAALRRIQAVGLGYLSLDRETSTVSGGEGQRLKTVRHLGSSLTDVTYIFDEPSVGLHPRDVERLNALLLALRDKGNTVLVVEHDRDVIAVADHVVDIGPGAGAHGGEVVYEGTVEGLRRSDTLTGRWLRQVPGLTRNHRTPKGAYVLREVNLHNLKNLTVEVPSGVLTAVTGVAGSGKSTLVTKALAAQQPHAICVDQSAIGISPRSTPATYVDIMDTIRKLFAAASGVEAGMFSFNSTGGCPTCRGRGVIQTDLAFLEPVTLTCETCEGRRYREQTLRHRLDGRNIVEVLELTVEEALEFFAEPGVLRKLRRLQEVGLGYLTLGQPLSTLSGGERQRLKLADRLHESGGLYLFDEPTTGLHMADVADLLTLLDRLVDSGNSVVVVEHDLDVVKRADWVIDLGPEAGHHGGRILFEGTPAALLSAPDSITADHLRKDLAQGAAPR
ncbi:excinuclease ABC subunit UvrA [Streptomyces smyrnaeus]|uniref:UvrABC system protein A n=1 Tax=Streptomyces smyrnaeus TaxID=1387713 RepID=A0ABS3XWL0_9ACTN|nr:excinuclease ABC subunit UvrA [Streptomyces smyrnaeus]MBO8199342.1 excinuclease ABC subunit UvrA [Streptomyces smyrnaeus]